MEKSQSNNRLDKPLYTGQEYAGMELEESSDAKISGHVESAKNVADATLDKAGSQKNQENIGQRQIEKGAPENEREKGTSAKVAKASSETLIGPPSYKASRSAIKKVVQDFIDRPENAGKNPAELKALLHEYFSPKRFRVTDQNSPYIQLGITREALGAFAEQIALMVYGKTVSKMIDESLQAKPQILQQTETPSKTVEEASAKQEYTPKRRREVLSTWFASFGEKKNVGYSSIQKQLLLVTHAGLFSIRSDPILQTMGMMTEEQAKDLSIAVRHFYEQRKERGEEVQDPQKMLEDLMVFLDETLDDEGLYRGVRGEQVFLAGDEGVFVVSTSQDLHGFFIALDLLEKGQRNEERSDGETSTQGKEVYGERQTTFFPFKTGESSSVEKTVGGEGVKRDQKRAQQKEKKALEEAVEEKRVTYEKLKEGKENRLANIEGHKEQILEEKNQERQRQCYLSASLGQGVKRFKQG